MVSTAVLAWFPGAGVQVGVIVGGGAVGWWLYRHTISPGNEPGPWDWRRHRVAAGLLVVFLLLLVLLPVLARATGRQELALIDSFYRAGSLVFGGGHVVLPLLRAEVALSGWLADDRFLAGYGAAQALPGPLFTFAGYLRTAIHSGPGAWRSGVWGLLAIFLPALLLIAGALPFWQRLRASAWTQAALCGANAAVVGRDFMGRFAARWREREIVRQNQSRHAAHQGRRVARDAVDNTQGNTRSDAE